MPQPLGKDARCSIARSLEVLGERWTLLIVREAFWGRTRFSEFRTSLGIAPDVLTDRLTTLVEHGVMERRAYRAEGSRERYEYVLTPAGEELRYVLGALTAWGDQYRPTPAGPATRFVEEPTGAPVQLRFVSSDGRLVDPETVVAVRNQAATASR